MNESATISWIGGVATVRALQIGSLATLAVTVRGKSYELPVRVVEDMPSAPLNQLAVYANCSDHHDEQSATGFIELAARVNGDPTRSTNTAIFQLLRRIRRLDPAAAEVCLAPQSASRPQTRQVTPLLRGLGWVPKRKVA